jgi:excisionase family DNA binding protein
MSTPAKTQTPTLPRLFSIKQVCERTGLSRRTIVSALSSGDLEHYRVGSRAIIPETAIIAWLESKRIGKRPRHRRAEDGGAA